MTDYDDLQKAIIANPNDPAPMLIAADWLEEHGDAKRAKTIRDCVERGRLKTAYFFLTEQDKRTAESVEMFCIKMGEIGFSFAEATLALSKLSCPAT